MNRKLKAPLAVLCMCMIVLGFGACKSQPEPLPEQKPEPVKPAESEEAKAKADELLQELAAARAEAVRVKADVSYPKQFRAADDTAAEAKTDYAAGNFTASQGKAQKAITQYRILINQTRIAALRAKIRKHNLSSYDSARYKQAEDLFKQMNDLFETDPDAAYTASKEALELYQSVETAGFAALMNTAKKKADEARARCDSVNASAVMQEAYTKAMERYRAADSAAGNKKYEQAYNDYTAAAAAFDEIYAAIKDAEFMPLLEDAKKKADEARARCDSVKGAAAMKDAYGKTLNRYRSAGIAAGNKKYEQAYNGYLTAAAEFDDIYEKVKIKREQANEAMERAKARQEASTRLAKDADREAPLPENAEGFSDEPIEVEPLTQPSGSKKGGN